MERHKLPKHGSFDTNSCSIETLRFRLHAEHRQYISGPRIADIGLAWDMAHAEKPYIDTALEHIAIAQQAALDSAKTDDSPYAQIRKYVFRARIENANREALNAVILAEHAATHILQATRQS